MQDSCLDLPFPEIPTKCLNYVDENELFIWLPGSERANLEVELPGA
jgi:hypothetical protein